MGFIDLFLCFIDLRPNVAIHDLDSRGHVARNRPRKSADNPLVQAYIVRGIVHNQGHTRWPITAAGGVVRVIEDAVVRVIEDAVVRVIEDIIEDICVLGSWT